MEVERVCEVYTLNTISLRSRIARFRNEPGTPPEQCFEYLPDGVLHVEDGVVRWVCEAQQAARQGFDLSHCEHRPHSLIMAGFVDAHVHAPQLDVIGSYGTRLLDWLQRYTFPAEQRFADEDYSRSQSRRFVRELLAHGSTSAMAFTTSFAHSADHLFEAAHEVGMRLIAGKVMMDRNAPEALLDSPTTAERDCAQLIERWHNKGRLGYALTPRFSGTSSREQLWSAGRLLAHYPDIWVHTHLSENPDEIAWTLKLFPEAADYLHSYELFGLHTQRTLFAHCLYLSDGELARIAQCGSSVAFCPSSNLFLGSGLFDLARAKAAGVPVALASDVGAGTSLSLLRTMADAYKVCQLRQYHLNALEAFYMSSLGAARALRIDDKVGSLEAGREADFIELAPHLNPFVHRRLAQCKTIEEELFVYMTCGDERLIARTFVAGIPRYQNPWAA